MINSFYVTVFITLFVLVGLFAPKSFVPTGTKIAMFIVIAVTWTCVWYLANDPMDVLGIHFPTPTYYISSHNGHMQLEGQR